MKILYFFTVIVLMSIVGISTLSAQAFENLREFEVGTQPMGIYMDKSNNKAHVICIGYDDNFNGVFEPDSGDVKPTWWVINLDKNSKEPISAQQVKEFEWGFMGFPFRPSYNTSGTTVAGTLILSQNSIVKVFSLDNYQSMNDSLLKINTNSISKLGNSLFFTVQNAGGDDKLYVYDEIARKLVDSLVTGENVAQSAAYKNGAKNQVAILSVGPYNEDKSMVEIAEKQDGKYTIIKKFEDLGKNANHIELYDETTLAVTMNGSHEIHLININNMELTETFDTHTSGFDGPRETELIQGGIDIFTYNFWAVSTYEGNVKLLTRDGELDSELEIDGKTEAMTHISTPDRIYFMVTVPNNADYSPNNKVIAYQSTVTSVTETNNGTLKLYPNPVENNAYIEFEDNDIIEPAEISIISLTGNVIGSFKHLPESGEAFRFSAEELELTTGVYFARIMTGNDVYAIKFRVVR